MQIITFRPKFQNQINIFFQEIWRSLGRRWPLSVDQDMFNIPLSYQKEGEDFWIALQEDKIIGTAGLRRFETHIAEFKRFYVHPDFQRQGIGSALLTTAIEKARNERYQSVRLDTKRNSQAMRMFSQKGFIEIEPYYQNSFAEVFMELELV